MGTPTFNLDDLRRVIQEQELAEQTESEGRRIPKEEGVLEVDAKISLERERILEQEALIQKQIRGSSTSRASPVLSGLLVPMSSPSMVMAG